MPRTLEPLLSMQCTVCRGEMLLKCVKAESADSDADIAIYHCERCGNELSYLLPYSADKPHPLNWDKPTIGNNSVNL